MIVKITTISGRHGAFLTRCAGNPTQAMWGAKIRSARVPGHSRRGRRPRRDATTTRPPHLADRPDPAATRDSGRARRSASAVPSANRLPKPAPSAGTSIRFPETSLDEDLPKGFRPPTATAAAMGRAASHHGTRIWHAACRTSGDGMSRDARPSRPGAPSVQRGAMVCTPDAGRTRWPTRGGS